MRQSKLFLLLLVAVLMFTACGTIPPAAGTAPPQTEAAEPAAPVTRTLIETHTIETVVGDMTVSTKNEYHYDPAGLLQEIIAYSGDAEVSRTTVENNEHGEPIRQTTVSGSSTSITESQRTYDADGNLTQCIDTVTQDGIVTDIREYTYNPDHTLAKAVFTTQGENAYATSNVYEYDENGNEIVEIITGSNGTSTRVETQYDENGRITRTEAAAQNAAGEIQQYVEYIYEADGSVKQQAYTPDGTPTPNYTVSTYNEYGNPLTTETHIGDTLVMRMTYTYVTITVG